MSERLADWIKFKFATAVLKELEEDRSSEIHVTDLVYDCLRRAYYEKTDGQIASEDSALVLWIGKKLHETEFAGCEHEKELSFSAEGVTIVGRADEVCRTGDGWYVVIDKKTCRRVPSSPYEHHVKQLEMYAAVLKYVYGYDVRAVAVLYIDVSNLESKVYVKSVSEMGLKAVLNEMLDKAQRLKKALEGEKPPEARPHWLCKYCPYWSRCIRDGLGGV